MSRLAAAIGLGGRPEQSRAALRYLKLSLPPPPTSLELADVELGPNARRSERLLADLTPLATSHEEARRAIATAEDEDEERARSARREGAASHLRVIVARLNALLIVGASSEALPGWATHRQ